jgi:hypothetical protein
MLPESIFGLIPPTPAEIDRTREQFRGYTDPILDPVAMAEAAADFSASLLLNPQRAARLSLQSARSSEHLSLTDLLDRLTGETILAETPEGYPAAIQRAVNVAVLRNMIRLAASGGTAPDVKAISNAAISNLHEVLTDMAEEESDLNWQAHYRYLAKMSGDFLEDPASFSAPPAPVLPPGSPIGGGFEGNFFRCSHF